MPQHIRRRSHGRRRPRLSSYDAITVVLAAIAVLAAMLLASPDSHADQRAGVFAQIGVTA